MKGCWSHACVCLGHVHPPIFRLAPTPNPPQTSEQGNKGAFIRFDSECTPSFTQFDAVPHPNKRPMVGCPFRAVRWQCDKGTGGARQGPSMAVRMLPGPLATTNHVHSPSAAGLRCGCLAIHARLGS